MPAASLAPVDRLAWITRVSKVGIAWPTVVVAVASSGSFVGLGLAAAAGAIPWAITIPLQGFAAFAGFTPVHDAAHRSIAPQRWLNELLGWICGVPILAPFTAFRYLHYSHHAYTNDPARDPDMWSSKARTRPGIAARWLVMDVHYLFRYLSEVRTRPRSEVISSGLMVVLMWTSWALLIATGHVVELAVCWLIPSRIAITTLSIVFDWIPHHPRRVTAAEDPYRASNIYEHRALSGPLLGQNYHLIHHLYPGVPFYRYGRVFWAMREELLDRGADVRRIGKAATVPARDRGELAHVTDIIDETPDTCTFVLGLRADHQPGQFVIVDVPVPGGPPLRRCYSISSSQPTLAITVKRHPGGRASTWLHDHLPVGAPLRVSPPAGRFVLAPSTRPLVLFAAGSGITPVIAILEQALATTTRVATLVYANRSPEHTIFRARLEALAARHAERFTLVLHFDDDRGRLDAPAISRHLDPGRDLYSCGPAGFLDLVEREAVTAGIASDHRFSERFTPRAAKVEGGRASSFTAIRHGHRHVLALRAGDTLLTAAQRAGLAPRSSCEDGYCGTCAARVVCGRISARSTGPLGDGDLARGFVLPCAAVPVAAEPVVVDFDTSP